MRCLLQICVLVVICPLKSGIYDGILHWENLVEECNLLVKSSLKAVFCLVCPEEASVAIEFFSLNVTHTMADLTSKKKNSSLLVGKEKSKINFALLKNSWKWGETIGLIWAGALISCHKTRHSYLLCGSLEKRVSPVAFISVQCKLEVTCRELRCGYLKQQIKAVSSPKRSIRCRKLGPDSPSLSIS